MSEKRQAIYRQRIYPHTLKRLDRLAKEMGVSRAEALERLIPHKRPSDGWGLCRYCDKHVKNPRGRHEEHARSCVLWTSQTN